MSSGSLPCLADISFITNFAETKGAPAVFPLLVIQLRQPVNMKSKNDFYIISASSSTAL